VLDPEIRHQILEIYSDFVKVTVSLECKLTLHLPRETVHLASSMTAKIKELLQLGI
jgi:hypothetical protein